MAEGRRYFIALGALIAGLSIIYITSPRLIAYAAMQSGDSVIIDLGGGKDVAPRDVSMAISGRQASLRWFDRGRTHLEIATLYLVLAENSEFAPSLRKSFLTKSIAAYRDGLSLAPRHPYSWLQFAQARFRQDRRSTDFNEPLRMSYVTAPQEPKIVITRVRLGFRAQDVLFADMRSKVREDIRLYLKHQPRDLTIFARKQFGLPWLVEITKSDPALLQDLYSQFLRLPPPGDL